MAAHLARVDLHNEAVNAVVTLASDTALAEAEAADRTLVMALAPCTVCQWHTRISSSRPA